MERRGANLNANIKLKSKNKKIFNYAGAYIMSVIGAGYATGQEFLQYFTSFGYIGIVGTILVTIFFAWCGASFMDIGYRIKASSYGTVLKYICGKHVGTILEWVLTIFLFGVVAIMLSGSGATISQYFGVNFYVGTVLMTIAVIITTIFGLDVIVKSISSFAPVTIILILLVSIVSIILNPSGISEAGQIMGDITLPKASPNWLISTLIYTPYCVLPIAPVIVAIGAEEEDRKLVLRSGVIGGIAIGVCIIIANLSMLSMVGEIAGQEVPLLYLAEEIWPVLGFLFTLILLGAIYTTASSVLYGFCSQFAKQGTRKYYWITIGSGIIATIAGFFPFSKLIGIISPILGYVGLIVMVAMVIKRHRQ